ncbi:alpha/beta fold hydrolase [Limibacillus halophilus]|uniref:Pimeloyl-ACP methyl ester carboxylesterase n=1 Tax=Limibacillus halophilus TaxID=1579333 RepID=A0A839SQK1_9PROT|nr:alpha/beta hydrolase [Limibacillus halophilus]MBB3064752.1 pimeloyl-ACP methyl ester carboxylesterase [Limibacillus halophilus]
MVEDYMVIDGTRLEYRWVGEAEAEGPVLVFLHEGLGCVALWRGFPEVLCQALGLRGIVYSRAGYGRSDACALPRPPTYLHAEALEVLPRVLDRAGVQEAVLIGHSDGGSIALIHASADAAGRVKAIVTLAAHVFNEELSIQGIREAREAFETGDLRDRLEKYHGANVDCAFYGWNDTWLSAGFRDWNLEAFLPDIEVPALILQGAEDQYGTPFQVAAIVAGIGFSASSALIPDCGHAPHLEQPEVTVALIREFLQPLI